MKAGAIERIWKNTAMMGGLLFIGATYSQQTLLPRTSGAQAVGNERAMIALLAIPAVRLDEMPYAARLLNRMLSG
jgi:hypothetical protein